MNIPLFMVFDENLNDCSFLTIKNNAVRNILFFKIFIYFLAVSGLSCSTRALCGAWASL